MGRLDSGVRQQDRDHRKVKDRLSIPKQDGRWRVSRSVSLWVLTRRLFSDRRTLESFGVLESVERTVYKLDGKTGEWVRYGNFYHPLHSTEEFSILLSRAKYESTYFFNNTASSSDDPTDNILAAPFIFDDEPAFAA